MLMIHPYVPTFIYGKMKKKTEYQTALQNQQICIAFEEVLCAAVERCNSDNLCGIFNGMLRNAISLLFAKKQHNSINKKICNIT